MEPSSDDAATARRVPAEIHFGTSSWVYPGWQGTVYRRSYRSQKAFREDCLAEYAAYPWFRAVGIDSTFYAPPRLASLQRYAGQLPPGFPWVAKLWQELSTPRFPALPRHGARAGQDNPGFLDPRLARERVLPAYGDPAVAAHTGALVLQLPPLDLRRLPAGQLLERLDAFLAGMPAGLRFGVEIRNRELLGPDYFALLNARGATHVFNHWVSMPPLREQMLAAAAAGGLSAPFLVARILTPLGVRYADAVRRFQPYAAVQQPLESMREDVLMLARRAVQRRHQAFIMVNNRAEGHAPGTIAALARRLAEGE